MTVEQQKMYSATKSLSDTASMEFCEISEKESRDAVMRLSIGKSVPASAQLPRGITSVRL